MKLISGHLIFHTGRQLQLMICFDCLLRGNPVLEGATNLGRGLVNFIFPFSNLKQERDDTASIDDVSLLYLIWYWFLSYEKSKFSSS